MNLIPDKKLLYGGDYNPEQWLRHPEILEKDIAYLKEAHINVVTLGIFSWSFLEPQEGEFRLSWMEERINTLYENGIYVILCTPTGSRPKWLAQKYPEVLRVDETRHRNLYGFRHNHCYTSPAYREKVRIIDRKLAQTFGKHPGVIGWHISNELGGECHCPLCQEAFRNWLKKRYRDIDELNEKWMTAFWSHTYDSFDQVESPSPNGEPFLHGLNLDWKRFVTDQTLDFVKWEIDSIRSTGADQPATTNMMYYFYGLNYFKFGSLLDFISWDSYPLWHKHDDYLTALDTGMFHDMMRSIKDQPFYLMESCPSATNWQSISKLKKPGLLSASSLQAVAHGSDSVLYFQIRQSRGSYEKFHGAVIDHYGGNDTRVFKEVSQVGTQLEALAKIQGLKTDSKAAVLFDWESRWAMEDSAGPRNKNLYYKETVEKFYNAFKKYGINVDVIDSEKPLDKYKVLAVPMLYMFRAGFEEKLRRFVKNGGTVLMTYWSGIADETDLCFLGGTPYGLMDVFGLRSEEIDALDDPENNVGIPGSDNHLGLAKPYLCSNLCDLVKPVDAQTEILMVYGQDFYQGRPALTCRSFGNGNAYYICADFEQSFYDDFCSRVLEEAGITPLLPGLSTCPGIIMASRHSEDTEYIFLQNFGQETADPKLPEDVKIIFRSAPDLPDNRIERYGTMIVCRRNSSL